MQNARNSEETNKEFEVILSHDELYSEFRRKENNPLLPKNHVVILYSLSSPPILPDFMELPRTPIRCLEKA